VQAYEWKNGQGVLIEEARSNRRSDDAEET
jgi:hypothetical protein